MFRKVIQKFTFNRFSSENWTTDQWKEHMLSEARTQRERDEVFALFSRYDRTGSDSKI